MRWMVFLTELTTLGRLPIKFYSIRPAKTKLCTYIFEVKRFFWGRYGYPAAVVSTRIPMRLQRLYLTAAVSAQSEHVWPPVRYPPMWLVDIYILSNSQHSDEFLLRNDLHSISLDWRKQNTCRIIQHKIFTGICNDLVTGPAWYPENARAIVPPRERGQGRQPPIEA